jgi:hypothetical protein
MQMFEAMGSPVIYEHALKALLSPSSMYPSSNKVSRFVNERNEKAECISFSDTFRFLTSDFKVRFLVLVQPLSFLRIFS